MGVLFPIGHVENHSYCVLRMTPLGKFGSVGTSSLSIPQMDKCSHSGHYPFFFIIFLTCI